MKISHILKLIYPEANKNAKNLDYSLKIKEGNEIISYWNTSVLGEQPTPEFLETKRAEADYKKELEICLQKRRQEYPPIEDYVDGIVKGDQVQIQKYIDDCLAVKAKYPKP
jgi:hypothetical protein